MKTFGHIFHQGKGINLLRQVVENNHKDQMSVVIIEGQVDYSDTRNTEEVSDCVFGSFGA